MSWKTWTMIAAGIALVIGLIVAVTKFKGALDERDLARNDLAKSLDQGLTLRKSLDNMAKDSARKDDLIRGLKLKGTGTGESRPDGTMVWSFSGTAELGEDHRVLFDERIHPELPVMEPSRMVLTDSRTGCPKRFPLGLDVRGGYPLAWELGADWEFSLPVAGFAVLIDPALTIGPRSGSLFLRLGLAR